MLEIGYIGRIVHNEYQPININAVPYMMTMGGQTFASAYAGLETSLGCAGPKRLRPGGRARKHQTATVLRSGDEPGLLRRIRQLHRGGGQQ